MFCSPIVQRDNIVGIGEIKVSNKKGDIISTFALGSCVAIVMYEPYSHTLGMAHVALPDSNTDIDKAKILPGYFADTAIPRMLEIIQGMTGNKRKKVIVKLAGGARVIQVKHQCMDIGQNNIVAIKRILCSHRLGSISEDIGKDFSRTVYACIDNGTVIISSSKKGERWEI